MLALTLMLTAAVPEAVPPCRVLTVAKISGEKVTADDLAPSVCPERQPPAYLRYVAMQQVAVARADLPVGTELGRAYAPHRPAVAPGQTVSVAANVGHVRIVRSGTAMQLARPGQRFFVRTADGQIFAAPPVVATSKASGATR